MYDIREAYKCTVVTFGPDVCYDCPVSKMGEQLVSEKKTHGPLILHANVHNPLAVLRKKEIILRFRVVLQVRWWLER